MIHIPLVISLVCASLVVGHTRTRALPRVRKAFLFFAGRAHSEDQGSGRGWRQGPTQCVTTVLQRPVTGGEERRGNGDGSVAVMQQIPCCCKPEAAEV